MYDFVATAFNIFAFFHLSMLLLLSPSTQTFKTITHKHVECRRMAFSLPQQA